VLWQIKKTPAGSRATGQAVKELIDTKRNLPLRMDFLESAGRDSSAFSFLIFNPGRPRVPFQDASSFAVRIRTPADFFDFFSDRFLPFRDEMEEGDSKSFPMLSSAWLVAVRERKGKR
jgi:hypothetical protein